MSYRTWLNRMNEYVRSGRSYELEENGDQIRGIAAPVRDASGTITAAISVSSATQYMDDARMAALSKDVVETAAAISCDLGWKPDTEVIGRSDSGRRG